ncbi:MAG: alpha/beta fold hydrolase, partial [Nocardioidaceae bacterium]
MYLGTSAQQFPGRDVLELTYRETGDGRPLLLLHGFLGSGWQWLDHGPAASLAELGYRVILANLRAHGDSAHPHNPASYPLDVLADDGLALLEWLDLDDYDLGGYSLGARVVLRMLARGAQPAHAIVAGQGHDAVTGTINPSDRNHRVLTALANGESLDPGSADADLAYWVGQLGGDPQALRHVLDTHVATPDATLRQILTPALVAVGNQDT